MLMEIYTSCSRVVPQILHTFLFQPFGSQKLHITNSLNPTGITSGAFQPSPWPAGYFCVMLPSYHSPLPLVLGLKMLAVLTQASRQSTCSFRSTLHDKPSFLPLMPPMPDQNSFPYLLVKLLNF